MKVRGYPLAEHLTGSFEAAPSVIAWLAGRLAGAPAPSNCPVAARGGPMSPARTSTRRR